MKKILSLLALLVTTVTSMAADYTDVLTFTLNLMGDHSVTQDAGTLTIEDNGDGTYNVIAKNADMGDYGSYGNIQCFYADGTTENGVTTIDVTSPECSNTANTSMTGTSLKVKFNSEKAWAEFEGKMYVSWAYRTFKYTFGTDEGFDGDTPVTPVVEYPINFDKDAKNNHSARRTSSISLQQEGKDVQTITLNSSLNGYEDHSEGEPFTVDAGSEVTPTFGFNGEWMHGYVYVDLDNNKQFDVNADDLDNSPELVAYSYYKDLNSDGESAAASVNVNPPSFTAPTVPGTYRIRFKIDWDNVDPGGCVESSNHILNNGGGIWDATLVVVGSGTPEPEPKPEVVESKPYTDKLSYTVNATTGTNEEQQLTVEKMSDGTYNLRLANVNSYNTLYMELGEVTMSGLQGTTDDNGVTTIEATAPTVTVGENGIPTDTQEGTLVAKFNGEKAYFKYNGKLSAYNSSFPYELTYGTDDSGSETPDPEVTKVVEDGYAPAGDKFAFPFSCDFATQKLVWEVDFTNAGWTSNQLVFTIGTSDADLSAWETTIGGNAHFYYTKSGADGGKLVLHYLHKGTRNDVDNIAVDNVTTFTLDAEGFHVGDQLAVAAEKLPKLYEGGTDFFFGSQEGAGRSNAVYNYVEVRPVGGDTPDTPFEAVTKTATDVAYTSFNGTTTNYEAKTVEVTEYEKDKYKVTYKQLTAGTTTLGDLTIDGVTATVGEDNVVTLSTEATEATWSNVDEFATIYFGMTDGSTTAINGFAATYTLNDAQEIAKLNLTFNFDIKGTEAKVVFGEQNVPEVKEVSNKNYTSNLRVYGADEEEPVNVVEKDEAVVNIVKYSDDTYKVTLKDIAWGENAATDLVFVGSSDAGIMSGKLDGEDVTDQGVSIMAVPDDATAAVLGEGVQAMFQWIEKAEDAIEMAFYLQIGETTYAGEFNYETPDEPKADYAINFDKDGQNHHASRRTTFVSLQQEGKDVQTLTFDDSTNGYEDHSEDMTFSVEAGSEVATTFGYNGEWMHGYVYIDLDGNKQFDVNADDLDNSPELVAYSYYNDLNSDGEAVSASVNVTPPTFTAPATPGTYRIRFKIDWNSVDPGGCADSGNHILNNGGGIWDATLKVTEPIVDAINSINAEAAQGNAEIFTVNGSKVAKLQKGINLVRTADGKVKKVLVK